MVDFAGADARRGVQGQFPIPSLVVDVHVAVGAVENPKCMAVVRRIGRPATAGNLCPFLGDEVRDASVRPGKEGTRLGTVGAELEVVRGHQVGGVPRQRLHLFGARHHRHILFGRSRIAPDFRAESFRQQAATGAVKVHDVDFFRRSVGVDDLIAARRDERLGEVVGAFEDHAFAATVPVVVSEQGELFPFGEHIFPFTQILRPDHADMRGLRRGQQDGRNKEDCGEAAADHGKFWRETVGGFNLFDAAERTGLQSRLGRGGPALQFLFLDWRADGLSRLFEAVVCWLYGAGSATVTR